MASWLKQTLVLVVIVIASALFVESNARDAADTSYQNSIAGCHRNNPRFKAFTAAVKTAAQNSTTASNQYDLQYQDIIEQPFIRTDGTTECKKAIKHP